MLIAKIIGTVWMMLWFLIIFKASVRLINKQGQHLAVFFSAVSMWLLIGFVPLAIVKFAWGFIR